MAEIVHDPDFVSDTQVYAFCKLNQESSITTYQEESRAKQPTFEDRLALNFINSQLGANPIKNEDIVLAKPLVEPVSADLETKERSIRTLTEMNESPKFSEIESLLSPKPVQSKNSSSSETGDQTEQKSEEETNWFTTTKKRKDVILKTVLRRCRKHYQTMLSTVADFKCSKKLKADDPLVPALRQVLEVMEPSPISMNTLFYLGCLVYPQDTQRNIDRIVREEQCMDKTSCSKLLDQIHGMLYKYSHEKLHEFCQVPALAFLFKNFYEQDQTISSDEDYNQGYQYVYQQCTKTLTKFEQSI